MIHRPDAPTVGEQVAVASNTDDLTWRPTRRPIDVVTAAGMVAQRSGMASAVMRFALAQDATAFVDARRAVRKAVKKRARAEQWVEPVGAGRMPSGMALTRLADACFRYWSDPLCRRCKGRKFDLVPGTDDGRRTLSTTMCPSCNGEGRRAFQMRTAWWQQRGKDVLSMIEESIHLAEDRLKRKLA